ncbi:MAG: nickel-dependent hydrogenase large subunit, partial [Gammaproteobacteria bacterium]|nr:nickel-dependent hydrogenase large subunit [Gammaproteobacteria bacterium]
ADHLSHFYLFFMPDFARAAYRDRTWFDVTAERFTAQTGSASAEMLPARAAFLHLTGLLAGKWPHSLALQPGGTTRAIEPRERLRLRAIVIAFRQFLEYTLFGDRLEAVAAIQRPDELREWAVSHAKSDFGRFLLLADDLRLDGLGRANDTFMSYGAYESQAQPQQHVFRPGLWMQREQVLDPAAITEDISHSWLHAQREPRHPFDGSTLPDADARNGYSWCKAPRYNGQVIEVGALARQQVDGHPLIRALVAESGGNVRNRVVARLLELARVVPVMETWIDAIRHGQPYCEHGRLPRDGEGMGLVEAARGSLGHWLRIKHGRILNYQIVAPTTWNFSPRDRNDTPGALEQALVNTPVDDAGGDAVAVQHVVRSFDPCMVCTVH